MSKQTKTTPQYIANTFSQDKKAWVGGKTVDGFYYECQHGTRVLMSTKFICAN